MAEIRRKMLRVNRSHLQSANLAECSLLSLLSLRTRLSAGGVALLTSCYMDLDPTGGLRMPYTTFSNSSITLMIIPDTSPPPKVTNVYSTGHSDRFPNDV